MWGETDIWKHGISEKEHNNLINIEVLGKTYNIRHPDYNEQSKINRENENQLTYSELDRWEELLTPTHVKTILTNQEQKDTYTTTQHNTKDWTHRTNSENNLDNSHNTLESYFQIPSYLFPSMIPMDYDTQQTQYYQQKPKQIWVRPDLQNEITNEDEQLEQQSNDKGSQTTAHNIISPGVQKILEKAIKYNANLRAEQITKLHQEWGIEEKTIREFCAEEWKRNPYKLSPTKTEEILRIEFEQGHILTKELINKMYNMWGITGHETRKFFKKEKIRLGLTRKSPWLEIIKRKKDEILEQELRNNTDSVTTEILDNIKNKWGISQWKINDYIRTEKRRGRTVLHQNDQMLSI